MAERLRARLDAGPTAADNVCVLRGKDVQRIAKQELGANVFLTTVHRTLQRLGDSCLAPRPRREKQDLDAQRQFREVAAPPCPRRLEAVRPGGWPAPPRHRIEIMDEARFGQQSTLARVWAPKGARPTAVKQTRGLREWVDSSPESEATCSDSADGGDSSGGESPPEPPSPQSL